MSNWTDDDLKALDLAIADGARKVKFHDREVEYRSLSDMITIRNFIARELGKVSGKKSDSFGKPITMVFRRE